jgi:hypothetical protein
VAVNYITEIEHRVAGIPCLIGVISYESEPQTWDDPGCTDMEWEILDRRGRPAPWLERKVTDKEQSSIEDAIYQEMEN